MAKPASPASVPGGAKASKTLNVHCPSCGELHPYTTDNPYRPFCSKGCKAIDLGAWASEQYRMDAKTTIEDDLPEAPPSC